MLAHQLRLTRPADFKRLREQGKTWRKRQLALNVLPNHLGHNRYGFVISRRVGGAVTRNRVKRQLRHIVRHIQERIAVGGQEGHDVAVIAYPSITALPYSRLKDEVGDLFVEAQIIRARAQHTL